MIKTLIVEDDPMVREINEKFLSKLDNFSCLGSAASVEQAKELINREVPDLILLDIFLINGRGIDLLKWVRAENIKCDVVLITADKNTDTVAEAFRLGAVDYLIKPFTFERFEKALLKFKNVRAKFATLDTIEQELIDDITINSKDTSTEKENVGEIKGFSQPTYDKILECVKGLKDKTFTSQEIAKLTGVSRITARRYLDYLEREEVLDIELEYGKVGRPKNKYLLK